MPYSSRTIGLLTTVKPSFVIEQTLVSPSPWLVTALYANSLCKLISLAQTRFPKGSSLSCLCSDLKCDIFVLSAAGRRLLEMTYLLIYIAIVKEDQKHRKVR